MRLVAHVAPLALLGSALFVACASDPAPIDPSDAGSADASGLDAAASDAAGGDAAVSDAAADSDAGGGASAFGFTLRVPGARELPCTGMACGGGTITAQDMDYVCDLHYGTFAGYVYVQSHGLSFLDFQGFLYEVDHAWYSDGTQATPTTATYLWGGNHHNDALVVDVPSYQVRFDHSSFGFGFRQCQPMDCAVVYAPGPGAELQNGCGRDRSVPVICRLVAADGTLGAWMDTFMRCAGDT